MESEADAARRHVGDVLDPHTGQAIISASADGIIAVDEDGVIRFCNPAAGELFGRATTDLLGTRFDHPIVAGDSTEVILRAPGGEGRDIEVQVADTHLDGTRLRVVWLHDVSHHRHARRGLEEALENQRAMAAIAAHELRNPLVAIGMLTQTLRGPVHTLTEEERSEVVDRIADRTVCLQSMIDKLMIAARIDVKHTPAPMERVPVLEVMLERLAEFGDRSGDVRVSCDSRLTAFVNRAELSEMLVNCLENAFAYALPPIEVGVDGNGEAVEIRIRDHGPGVPEDLVPYLFNRFSRGGGVERCSDGSGLGLWIVRNLARGNDGDVYYERADGGGACFCLRLRSAPPVRTPA